MISATLFNSTDRVADMNNEKTEKSNPEPSEEFQRFEDVANKIFQVPVEEVRELEKNGKQNKPDEA